jgi:transcriptional regulator with XRE-family HTH domain
MSEFSERLEKACKASQISQKDIALMLGVSPATLNGWIKGTREPNIPMIRAIASLLNISIDWLIDTNQYQIETDAKKEQLIRNYELLNSEAQETLVDFSEMLVSKPRNLKNKAPPDKDKAVNE